MTFARPAGLVPAGPASLERTIGRTGLFAGAGVLAAINAQAAQLINALTYSPLASALLGLGGISAVIWFAMYAVLKIGIEPAPSRLRRWDTAILLLVALLSFVPVTFAANFGLLLCAVYLFASSKSGEAARRVSLVLLALTGPLLWGRVLLHLFAAPILALDAHIVASAIGSSVIGNTVQFADSSKSFLIGGPCSSVHNISLALVLWTTAAVLFDVRIDRRYVAVGAAMVAWMFVINIARLASIGLFPAEFHFLHEGAGAAAFGWAALIGAALLAGLGVIGAADRQQR